MTRRVQKVAELLREQLAWKIKESIPEEMGIVTVTEVEVSPDIKRATIFISCLDKTYEGEVIKKLEEKTRDFQHLLGRNLKMRYTPKLAFKIDRGLEKVGRVEEILEGLEKK